MDEYIEREAFAEDIRESYYKLQEIYETLRYERERDICNGELGTFCEILLRLKDFPAADVAPVVWMPVLGFEGLYEVSGLGQVRNQKGEILKQGIKRTPCTCYKVVHLWKDGVYYTKYVHRLIAEAFIPNPDNLPMVNHKDEDKTNNFLENLEWCTAAYNRTYGKAVERQAKKLRGRESEKRVAVVGCTLDGKCEEWFPSIAEAAKIVKGSTSAISKVCRGERKTAYGYRWAYADDFCSYGEKRCR